MHLEWKQTSKTLSSAQLACREASCWQIPMQEAADVFGELEDLRDRLQASEQARLATETSRPSPKGKDPDSHAADRQDLSESLHVLKADLQVRAHIEKIIKLFKVGQDLTVESVVNPSGCHILPRPEINNEDMLQAQKEAAEDAQREAARSMKDVKIAQEITKQVQEEMSSKLQMAAAERETLLQRLQAVQHSAQPSAEDVSDLSQSHLLAAQERCLGLQTRLLLDTVLRLALSTPARWLIGQHYTHVLRCRWV